MGLEIVSTPRLELRVTVAPETRLLLASRRVTVIVEMDPSDATEVGFAVAEDVVLEISPAVKFTITV